MTKRKKPTPPPPEAPPVDPVPVDPPPERSIRRNRFSWDGDDVLHLEIDGDEIKSTPPDKQ